MTSPAEKYVQDVSLKPDVGKPLVSPLCSKCQAALRPQRHRCPICGSRQSPLLVVILPILLVLLALFSLIGGIVGGLSTPQARELPQALAVMVPVFLFLMTASLGMFFGKTFGWHLLTVILGLLTLLGAISLLLSADKDSRDVSGLCAAVFFWTTMIYIAVVWRTAKLKRWRAATIAYAAINIAALLFLLLSQAGEESFSQVILATAFVGIVGLLNVLSYSIHVRWWYRVRLGWMGSYLDEDKD